MFEDLSTRIEPDGGEPMTWTERLVRWVAAISVTALVFGLLNYAVRMLE